MPPGQDEELAPPLARLHPSGAAHPQLPPLTARAGLAWLQYLPWSGQTQPPALFPTWPGPGPSFCPPHPATLPVPPVRALTAAGLAVAQAALLQHPFAAAALDTRCGQAGARPRLQASPAVPRTLAP